jgi:hypothetical protein
MSKGIVSVNSSSFGSLEEEDRLVIEGIAKRFQEFQPSAVFSNKSLPSRVLLRFYNLSTIGIEDLRRINISTHRIRAITIHLSSQTTTVELQRKQKKPVIKRRKNQPPVDKALVKATVDMFLKRYSSIVREADERLLRAVLGVLLRWTWNTAAAEVNCRRVGDNYLFEVKKVQRITLKELEKLCDLGEYVQDLIVRLKEKVIRFSVLRTSSYIQDDRQKRRKTIR